MEHVAAAAALNRGQRSASRTGSGRRTEGGTEGSAGFCWSAGLSPPLLPAREDGRLGLAPTVRPTRWFGVAMRTDGESARGCEKAEQVCARPLPESPPLHAASAGPRVDDWRAGATTSDHNKTMWPRTTERGTEGREGGRRE